MEKSAPNDLLIRLIGIPAFGLLIPNLTGLARNDAGAAHIFLQYGWFILIAFCIWHGNRFLLFTLRRQFSWFSRPLPKILSLVAANTIYTVPVSLLLLHGWYRFIIHEEPVSQIIFQVTLLNIICVLFVTQVYETVFLLRETENERLRAEQLERARAEAELNALRNQVDPHFMFNSLNTLSHLIATDPPRAEQFNNDLADVYRYILTRHNQQLVTVEEEKRFLETYFSLLRIRFRDAVQLHSDIDASLKNRMLPPASLQTLVENAVKHNAFSENDPLHIYIRSAEDEISVYHRTRLKQQLKTSAGTGLKNLSERCRLLCGKEMKVTDSENEFRVTIPLKK